jgi:heptosyltransferase I
MKVLIIKTSSMGDIIHSLPALTDAKEAIPNIQFDWVVEERFQIIPAWHPAVDKVIPVAIRRWRKSVFSKQTRVEMKAFFKNLRETNYDLVIDAQGLLKAAWIVKKVKAPSCGLNFKSVRESLSSLFYNRCVFVRKKQHAVERIRQLFSQALYYSYPVGMADYAVDKEKWQTPQKPYVLFFHGTTWANKHWPIAYWKSLASMLRQQGMAVKLSWGSDDEREASQVIADDVEGIDILPDLNVEGLMPVIANAKAVVAVDTGLGHLAAALNIPTVALFGPTDPEKTGLMGEKQVNLVADFSCAPCLKRECGFRGESPVWPACFATVTPERVMAQLKQLV